MFKTADERNAFVVSLLALHPEIFNRQVRLSPRDLGSGSGETMNVDDVQDLWEKLLISSPDFLNPQGALGDVAWLDGEIARVQALSKAARGDRKKLKRKLARLERQRDEARNHGAAWMRTVLFNQARDRIRAENRHERILREHFPELSDLYHAGTAESAEAIVMRILAEEDIRARINRLPRKLGVVAALLYDGWSGVEIARELKITEAAVWRRAFEIRSPRIRRALDLGEDW